MDSNSVKTTEQTTLHKSTVQLNNSRITTTDPEATNNGRITDFTKTDQQLHTKNTISPHLTTNENYPSRSLDTSSDHVKSMTNLSTIDKTANPDFSRTTDSSVVPSNGTAAIIAVNVSITATTGKTTDPLVRTSTFRNNYETSETNTEINADRRTITKSHKVHDTHTTMRFMNTITSVPDTSYFTTSSANQSESYSSFSQNHGANKVTEYEKWFNETTTESTFDQTSLSVNAESMTNFSTADNITNPEFSTTMDSSVIPSNGTGSETGNVTIAEVSEGMLNASETTDDPSVPIAENVTTFNTDVLSRKDIDG